MLCVLGLMAKPDEAGGNKFLSPFPVLRLIMSGYFAKCQKAHSEAIV